MHPPWIVAHRGARDQAPENSRSALDAALAHPIHGMECDLQITRDGVPVLYHDRTLARITGRRKRISDFSLRELRALDWGAWYSEAFRGEGLLTLEETLERYAGRTRLFLEIKSRPSDRRNRRSEALTLRVLELLRGLGPESPGREIYLLSFDPEVLRLAAREAPDRRYILNLQNPAASVRLSGPEDRHLQGICIPIRNLTKTAARAVRAAGRRLLTYACNVPRQVNKALALEADVLLTDRPGWLVQEFQKRGLAHGPK